MRAADFCFPTLLSPRAPVSRRFSTGVGAARAPRSPRGPECFTTLCPLRRVALPELLLAPSLFDASWGVFFPSRAARPYLWHLRHRTRALLAELSRARPRPSLPRRPVKGVEAPRSEVPSTAGESRPPPQRTLAGSGARHVPSSACDSLRSPAVSRLRFACASPWHAPFGVRARLDAG